MLYTIIRSQIHVFIFDELTFGLYL